MLDVAAIFWYVGKKQIACAKFNAVQNIIVIVIIVRNVLTLKRGKYRAKSVIGKEIVEDVYV